MITEFITTFVSSWICIIFFHELGHWGYLRYVMEYPAKIIFSRENSKFMVYVPFPDKLFHGKRDFEMHHYMCGVMLGIVPIFLFATIYPLLALNMIPYLFIGCKGDIKEIWKLLRA